MSHSSRAEREPHAEVADFQRRYETLGNPDEVMQPATTERGRRTFEDCVRETEEQRLLGIRVICHPTWEDIEQAHDEVQARTAER